MALAVTAVGWLEAPGGITGAEAVAAARGAFAAAGLADGDVRPQAEPGDYPSGRGRPPIPVWKTFADVEGGTVELWLARSDGESVFLDDRTPDGTAQLLSEAQFAVLADHYENPALGRQVRRNLVLTAAAALLALVAATIAHGALVPPPDWRAIAARRPARSPVPAAPPEPAVPPAARRAAPLRAAGPGRRDRPLRRADRPPAPPLPLVRPAPRAGATRRERPLRSPMEST